MIYLDYCATTPVDKRVLNTFNKVCLEYPGNSNSLHKLGENSKELEDYATKEIEKILKLSNMDVIYTSGASESNNHVLKGVCSKYKNRGNHIITTYLEHSSIISTANYLSAHGFIIDYVKINNDGEVDLEHLRELMTNNTILVSIAAVDSELGIIQPLKEISAIVKEYPKCFFHSDCTQALGKIEIDFSLMDFVSVSMHKIYGMKGIGLLLKKKNIIIDNLIHGGKSSTNYRSGTPALPLIVSSMKALDLIIPDIKKNYEYVSELSDMIKEKISKYKGIHINSTIKSVCYVINFSVSGIKPETFIHALDSYEVYVSTKSACSNAKAMSDSVYVVTKNREYASSSIRISLSPRTTKEEVVEFLKVFDICYERLSLKD